ncbi:apolipoprotein N-acyltransferase [Halovulum dunhuangense]|uniref:Apolipoprotein N-acyltransferase n=2 Tax=Halovulum dunhuangense TaxID=1505036 RepID=A0A849KQR6_9RHOB|nr:apolipoprotein N-acyltransferase [Halovulum dunhuangense]NNU79413.1 apolipoprotein N-acyltransferase [Halovulum dunhuangense]
MALGAGAAMGLGHAPYDLPFAALLALPLLFHLWQTAPGWRGAAMTGWLAGTGYFGLTLSWIVEPFLIDVARHGFMAPFALVFMATGLALFWALGFGVARRAVPHGRWAAALGLATALALSEALRAFVLTGFPWALPGYAWTGTPVAQAAALVGPHGLTALVLLLCLLPALLRPAPVLLGLGGLAALWGAGAIRLAQAPAIAPDAPAIRLVQPNASQQLKWRGDMVQVFYERQIAFTQAPAEAPLAAVIWSETAVPFLLDDRPDLQADIAAAAGPGTAAILGIRRLEGAENWYNTLAVLDAAGGTLASYDKHHLVPFGEYMPLRDRLRALGLSFLADGLVGSFSTGPGPRLLSVPGLPPFQPLICYEAIFPHQILRGPDRPDWLLQITNDAWFGSWSGPYQHLAQARMRAIEQGLPLARAANTGVSAMIDGHGRITRALPLNVAGFIDAALPPPLPPTPYARLGDAPVLAALLALLLTAALTARRRG